MTMRMENIETPALVVDFEALQDNMAAMKQLVGPTNMELFPHYKSNKCPDLARMQLEAGALGITCAKLSEALDLAESGVNTIVLANQVVQPSKLEKLANLAGKVDLTVCVDEAKNILDLEAALAKVGTTCKIFVEYDVGLGRCGARSHEEFLALAQLVNQQPHLSFDGIQAYAGHLSHETDAILRKKLMDEAEKDVASLKDYLERNDLTVNNIAGGSTGTAADKPPNTVYTQLQAGSYLFMDSTYQTLNLRFKQSLFVLATVISIHDNLAILDCGAKCLGMDQNLPVVEGFEDAEIEVHEEHMLLKSISGLKIGMQVKVIPGHCCTTVNMADNLVLAAKDGVYATLPIKSRGKCK